MLLCFEKEGATSLKVNFKRILMSLRQTDRSSTLRPKIIRP